MFTVPIIVTDLRHEETIISAVNSINCLQKTINSIFDRIDERIASNNEKVQNLGERIERVKKKLDGLKGTKKAVRVYAPARFPSSHLFVDIPSTFRTNLSDCEIVMAKTEKYEVPSHIAMPIIQSTPKEKLMFFHVRSPHTNGAFQSTVGSEKYDLGEVPNNLHSIKSILLFNTEEPIYGIDSVDGESKLITWKQAKLFRNKRQGGQIMTTKQLLEPAPHSLANRNQMLTPSGALKYTPKLNEAPEIDLPLYLPSLPGIANDIHYEGKAQEGIAPSLYVDDLPELSELEESDTNQESALKNTNFNVATTVPSETLIPPPPPDHIPPVALPTPPPPPPPPPPPIPVAATRTTLLESTSTNRHQYAVPDVSDTRSELMDAIRKAGGAHGGRLRHAAAAPVNDDANVIKTKTSTVGESDLMADLHNKLLMRRKGISGAKDNPNKLHNSNTVISHLSALIPPPPTDRTKIRAKIDEDDDDEEEENDWND